MMDIIFAILGGVSINLCRYFELCKSDNEGEKEFAKRPVYWFQFIFTAILGGVFSAAYKSSGVELNAILDIQIGASAPLILKSLASSLPPINAENAA